MKKLIVLWVLIAVLVSAVGFTGYALFGSGYTVVANDVKLIKTGLIGQKLTFSDSDFKSAYAITDFDSVSIDTLPSSNEGTLLLAGRRVKEGQRIKRKNVAALIFVPASTEVTGASFDYTLSYGGTDTPGKCEMKFIDKISTWKPLKDEDGKEKKLILLVNSDDSARLRAARSIAETLTDLGVPCGTLEYGNSSNPSFEVVLRANNWDLLLGETRLSPNNDLSEFYRNWGLLNYGGITNKTLLSQTLLALENQGNYYNLLKDAADTASIIPVLFGYYTVYAERGLLDDLSPSRDNVFYYSLGKTMADVLQS